MYDNWPRSRIEQIIHLQEMDALVSKLELAQTSIVVSAYNQPVRSDWESAYISKGGSPPIPPGTQLFWYNMRSGFMEPFMTTFDRDGGLTSSGEVYSAATPQNKQPFRFLGTYNTVSSQLAGSDDWHPLIFIGENPARWRLDEALSFKVYFSIHPALTTATSIILQWGGTAIQSVLPVTNANYQMQGDLSGDDVVTGNDTIAAQANVDTDQTSDQILTDTFALSGVSTSDVRWAGELDIYNPFSSVKSSEDLVDEMISPPSVNGWAMYQYSTTEVVFHTFASVRTVKLGLDDSYHMLRAGSPNANGKAWVYGYFGADVGSVREYPGELKY